MNNHRTSSYKQGFTLMELMVAMAITTIIVTVLVSITSIAMDTWNRSRSELRAARQAKAMVDGMARDFEALVVRRGNTNEWLSATSVTKDGSPNAAELIFFTAATDRYNGEIGTTNDKGGDVSCAAYRLSFKDPITSGGTFNTYVLNRLIVNPDKTFTDLLGKASLTGLVSDTDLDKMENFVCENIYQFTITFNMEVTHTTGTTSAVLNLPVTIGQAGATQVTSYLKIKGSGVEVPSSYTPTGATADELKAGRVTSVEISVTVLSDSGVDVIRKSSAKASDPAFLAKNTFQYTKRVFVPSM